MLSLKIYIFQAKQRSHSFTNRRSDHLWTKAIQRVIKFCLRSNIHLLLLLSPVLWLTWKHWDIEIDFRNQYYRYEFDSASDYLLTKHFKWSQLYFSESVVLHNHVLACHQFRSGDIKNPRLLLWFRLIERIILHSVSMYFFILFLG